MGLSEIPFCVLEDINKLEKYFLGVTHCALHCCEGLISPDTADM